VGPLHSGIARPRDTNGRGVGETAPDMKGSCGGQPTGGWTSTWGLGKCLRNLHRENPSCYEMLHRILGGLLWTRSWNFCTNLMTISFPRWTLLHGVRLWTFAFSATAEMHSHCRGVGTNRSGLRGVPQFGFGCVMMCWELRLTSADPSTLNHQWMVAHSLRLRRCTRVYPKVSGLSAWSENCKWYSSLPLGAVVSLFCESV
jgi:hypothetical protein